MICIIKCVSRYAGRHAMHIKNPLMPIFTQELKEHHFFSSVGLPTILDKKITWHVTLSPDPAVLIFYFSDNKDSGCFLAACILSNYLISVTTVYWTGSYLVVSLHFKCKWMHIYSYLYNVTCFCYIAVINIKLSSNKGLYGSKLSQHLQKLPSALSLYAWLSIPINGG